jgi:hypothetical protein
MKLIGLDWETYYGDGFTLSRMTTEEYVRDPRFEEILLSIKIDSAPPFWVPRDQIGPQLAALQLEQCAVYSHHAHFDMLILAHHHGIRPKLLFDTLSMARALHGANNRNSLAKLCEQYSIGQKGDEVHNVKGMHYVDFDPAGLSRYGTYSCNDIEKTYLLLMRMLPQFAKSELEIHDQIIRMFTEPVFDMDATLLAKYRDWIATEKTTLLLRAGVQLADVMSAEKFATALRDIGIEPPMKISPTTGKLVYAFAKTDVGIQALQEHPDEIVQVLVEARLKNKVTLMERGCQRLIDMAGRGSATVYLKVSGASGTHRLSGGDKFNWQSIKRGSDIRRSVRAPKGSMCVVCDSSTIEARLLDWISGQDDMVEVYRKADAKLGPDMYCTIAERIYSRPITKEQDPDERQMGKRTKLGLGFGMGDTKFGISVRREAKNKDGKPLVLEPEFTRFVVYDVYRKSHQQVCKLWRRGEDVLRAISQGKIGVDLDYRGIVKTCKNGLIMPNGLKIQFPDLKFEPALDAAGAPIMQYGQPRGEWTFWNGKMREHIYGAKVIENIIQCLARIIVFAQCMGVVKECHKRSIPTKWAHSVHDEGVFVSPEFFAPLVQEIAMRHFRTTLPWCDTLPLNCESGIHISYGEAKS